MLGSEQQAQALTQTTAMPVSTNVFATCTMSVATQLDLGTVDLSSPSAQIGSGMFSVTCTNGAPVYITLGQGLYPGPGSTDINPVRQMSAGGSDRLDYDIFRDAGFTQPWGNTQATGATLGGTGNPDSAMVYARIPAGQHVMSGVYVDTVLATVTY